MLELEQFIEKVATKVTVDTTANLIETTPVDTGWARSNWVPSIGGFSGSPAGSKENVSDSEQAVGIASLAGYKISKNNLYISNNVPYIGDLNDGTSTQAPSGFVQNAIAKAVSSVI